MDTSDLEQYEILGVYAKELEKAMGLFPERYMYTPSEALQLARRMLYKVKYEGACVSLYANPALKAACKRLGVTTFKGLQKLLDVK